MGCLMVKCEDCKREMDAKIESCALDFRCIKIKGEIFPRDTCGKHSYDYNEYCHDCGILNRVGNLHHFGCDIERCPACGGQLISCDCKKEAIGVNGKWKKVK